MNNPEKIFKEFLQTYRGRYFDYLKYIEKPTLTNNNGTLEISIGIRKTNEEINNLNLPKNYKTIPINYESTKGEAKTIDFNKWQIEEWHKKIEKERLNTLKNILNNTKSY